MEKWKPSVLKDLLRKNDNTGNCLRKTGSGRPKMIRTNENFERVEKLMSQDDNVHSHSSPGEIERDTGIVSGIIKSNLRLSQYKRKPGHDSNFLSRQAWGWC